jgi:hypothetical protein
LFFRIGITGIRPSPHAAQPPFVTAAFAQLKRIARMVPALRAGTDGIFMRSIRQLHTKMANRVQNIAQP